MPKKIQPGQSVKGYKVTKLHTCGAMAISYLAEKDTQKIFFKQYKSPSVTVSWYGSFVKHQRELKRRIEAGPARQYCVKMVDTFEAEWGHKCLFQAFEFVEKGLDLQAVLEQGRKSPGSVTWDQRVTFSKVLLAGVRAIHTSLIVHADLKPANVQLIEDASIASKYQVKLIDMDFSLLSDQQAPWHGQTGYIGSPNYYSPEHLAAGSVPGADSDVFTCGLILYELLCGKHPLWCDDPADYNKRILSNSVPDPVFLGSFAAPVDESNLRAMLRRSLAPDRRSRPTANELNLTLNGRTDTSPASKPTAGRPGSGLAALPAAEDPRVRPEAANPASSPARTLVSLELVSVNDRAIRFNINTDVGKALVIGLGADSQFYSSVQFGVTRSSDGDWFIEPRKAQNPTLLNGKELSSTQRLKTGDVVAVGNEAKKITKLPLTVRIL